MFLEMIILISILFGLIPLERKNKKESPGELRLKDKAFRKDRRERELANTALWVEIGNGGL